MNDLVIIKYNAGNIQSVLYALERIGVNALVTDDYEKIKSAKKVIFPGVGEASSAMRYLKDHKLDTLIKDLQQPVLGICLGMQLMCAYSEENDTICLGIFDEQVKKFIPPTGGDQGGARAVGGSSGTNGKNNGDSFKVPQIGWNNIFNLKTDLYKDLPENSFCYFVHGYYAALGEHTIATANYIQPYSASLHKGNFYGAQFHPEKSARAGEQILKNFLSL
jgi:imidazole glycerol-phosphate synthase subunit HisH